MSLCGSIAGRRTTMSRIGIFAALITSGSSASIQTRSFSETRTTSEAAIPQELAGKTPISIHPRTDRGTGRRPRSLVLQPPQASLEHAANREPGAMGIGGGDRIKDGVMIRVNHQRGALLAR
jgi:hypothetical protein